MAKALFPGSFDPLTNGHLDLIRRGVEMFGGLTVAIATNSAKRPLFTAAERVEMIRAEVAGSPVEVVTFHGLVVEFCRERGYDVLLRGLRTAGDFEYEYQMALTNRHLAPEIETVFVMPNQQFAYTSSTLIREIVAFGGAMSAFLPGRVEEMLRKRLSENQDSKE